ncbi:MAG: hypothetical protein KDB99_04725 [Chitinophagaceae bacterium]|nr:hypothetical protein [Chitinophagaceae bacterium]MCB9056632.1 hypothetical protein [Chitinophagales bacterium]
MREVMLIIHFIGLAMGLGTSIGFIFLGAAASKMEKADQQKFMVNSFALSNMGKTGLVLLVLSGGYLMTPYWSSLTSMPLLMIKLGLVLLLIVLIIILTSLMSKVKKGEAEKYAPKIPIVGRISLLTVLAIVILAVYNFH